MSLLFDFLPLIPIVVGAAMLTLSILSLWNKSFIFWPPPNEGAWQHRVFRLLFRIMFYGLVVLTIALFWRDGIIVPVWMFYCGVVLMTLGFGVALLATGFLGWRQAFGVKEGLRTDGLFSVSRHPVYVATWFAMAGWSLILPNTAVLIVLAQWALIYLIAIFLEERWLHKEFGIEYQDYTKSVPRFLGWNRNGVRP